MATLIKITGETREIHPVNGTDFNLKELQNYVDGLIEIVYLSDGKIFVINEEGKFLSDINDKATEIAHKHNAIFDWDYIAGDVVLCDDEQVK